jgi:hypothetical protein
LHTQLFPFCRNFSSDEDLDIADFCVKNHFPKDTICDLLKMLRKKYASGKPFDIGKISFKSADALLGAVSSHIPDSCLFHSVPLEGFEGINVHLRDAKALIEFVLSGHLHRDNLVYDHQPTPGVYSSLESGSWWQYALSLMPEVVDPNTGQMVRGTLCPVIISSDKTNITFSGSKGAHNVYMSLGLLGLGNRQKTDG